MLYTIQDLSFLTGNWTGTLQHRQVDENWSAPLGDSVFARACIVDNGQLDTVELIQICATESALQLRLRQFEPDLRPKLEQDMQLDTLTSNSASFVAPTATRICGLRYTRLDRQQLTVDVSIAGGHVLTAQLTLA